MSQFSNLFKCYQKFGGTKKLSMKTTKQNFHFCRNQAQKHSNNVNEEIIQRLINENLEENLVIPFIRVGSDFEFPFTPFIPS